jgi:hypothetical protein
MENEQLKEKFGVLIDSIDNLAHALQIQMPATVHVQALRESLPEKVKELKEVYVEITGENPWTNGK